MDMRKTFLILCLFVLGLMMGCTGCGDTKDATQTDRSIDAGFERTKHVADSLYSCMQFRDAYDLYLQLLNSEEAKRDNEKQLYVLNSLCMASELSGHKAEQTKWLQQLLDLATQSDNDYYRSLALMSMGLNVFYEGDRKMGIQYVSDAIGLMGKTDRTDTDHLTHGYLIMLARLYGEMKDNEGALKACEHNLQLTMDGTRWGNKPNLQLIDRRMALAKMAALLAKMGNFQRADSAYAAWKAVQYEGNHTRDYFIVDYMKRRGRYQEAVLIFNDLIQRVREQGDTLGEMMNTAKWGLADVYQKMGHHKQAAELYQQVLEIQDTLKSRKARNTAQELAAVYHAQEQQQTIMQQEAENTRQRYILIIVLAVLLGMVALAAIVIVKNRTISYKNRALVRMIEENIKLKIHPQSLPLREGSSSSLFVRLATEIREQQLYLNPVFDRQAVCDRFHLTAMQVGNAFAQGSDYDSVADFIRDCRLEHACHLLKTTNMTIANVAACSGFSRVTTFNHDFKSRYNISPTEYRRQ